MIHYVSHSVSSLSISDIFCSILSQSFSCEPFMKSSRKTFHVGSETALSEALFQKKKKNTKKTHRMGPNFFWKGEGLLFYINADLNNDVTSVYTEVKRSA